MMFLHLVLHVILCNRIQVTSNLIHHLHNRNLSISCCKEFHNIKTNSTAAHNNNLLACHIFRIVIDVINHSQDRSNLAAFFVNAVVKSSDRRKQWRGTCGAYDQVRMELADIFRCSFCVCEDIKILKLLCSVNQIVWKISQTLLCRDLRDHRSKTAKSLTLFQKEGITAYFCGCTGSFQSGSTASDYYNVTVLVHFLILINITFQNSRVYSTADRTVKADSVSCTSDVTGDTFAKVTFSACSYFIHPCRFCDKTTSHTDQVCIAVSEDLLGNLRVTDISHGDTWLAEFLSDSFRHIGTPSVFHVVGIDLILDRTV